jgi:polyisoprenoid-binding protein YceI
MGLPIDGGVYAIDSTHSQLGFSVSHLGISTIRGTFDDYSGELSVADDLSDTSVTIEAKMASINTGNAMRDGHMHGAEFFDVDNHPLMTFRSTSIAESGSGYALTGELTIKGITLPVTFDVAYNGAAIFPVDQSTHFGFAGRATISRSAFGVSYGVPMVSDDVHLALDIQFVHPAAAAE